MSRTDQFQNTLQLPKTSFPMQARLPQKEPEILKTWLDSQIHSKMLKKRQKAPCFFLPDGPPYANGNIHLGHVLNKILKDIVIKYKNLSGYLAPFIPSWDCHGLPIEMAALKRLGDDQKDLPPQKIREACRQEAQHWVKKQEEGFKRLGVLAHWEQALLTMNPDYEAEEVKAFSQMVKKNLIYRGTKPVLWCFKLQTAIAFSEAEYREHKSPSIYVKFDLDNQSQKKINSKHPCSFVIWTTTPWTLPANTAICLNKNLEYGLYEKNNQSYLIATALEQAFSQETGLSSLNKIKTFKGKELEGLQAQHPFLDRKSPCVLGDHVTTESGTGCVHTAPGHGLEDYAVGKQYQLPHPCPVDERGHFTNELPESLRGLFIFKGNKVILKQLQDSGHLLGAKEIKHSYPYNPRSDSPLIYRLTPQWFLDLDQKENNIRDQAMKSSENKIKFIPDWGKNRLEGMLKSNPDWCLSRQRMWGVPIVVFYCESCKTPLLNPQIIDSIAEQMKQSQEGIEFYFSRPVSQLLPPNTKCQNCQATQFKKGEDILDVWFDSGIQHTVFKNNSSFNLPFPSQLFLEGSDQHRGWFQTSLISSLALHSQPPFKNLLTHGFVNDKEGKKMSKSKGNVLDPSVIIQQSGAEILRLWVSSENYVHDINASQDNFKRITEAYRRFRNTVRFILGNLNDFDSKKHLQDYKTLPCNDQWMLAQLNALIESSTEAFDQFAFYKVYHLLNHFFTVTLSSFYLDIIKDRLYTFGKESPERRQAQTVIYHTLNHLLPLMAPITSFLCEEAYAHLPGQKEESVFLEDFPKPHPEWNQPKVLHLFEKLMPLREDLNKQIEVLRQQGQLGSHLEAEATLQAASLDLTLMNEQQLFEFFSVSKVHVDSQGKLSVKASLASGEKCVRCWFYSEKLNSDKICPKCVKNLS